MNDDTDFDTWLEQKLHEEPLADAAFCAALEQRMAGRRSQRGALLIIATLCAIASVGIAVWLMPSAVTIASPANVAAALLLTALCGMVWIATETPAPRGTTAAG